MKRLAIIGAGDLGMQIAHLATMDASYSVAGFFDDTYDRGATKGGYPVIGKTADAIDEYRRGSYDSLMIGIGYRHMAKRKELFLQYKGVIPFANIIHTTCYIDPTAQIGEGILMYPGCIIDKGAVISDNVILNLAVVVSHDSSIGSHSFLAPGVKVAGFTSIGECANLGIGSIVIDNLAIGNAIRTGGGAVVVHNINDPGLYIGSPAKFHKA